MVEREAMIDEERPLVAAVIYNRLNDGMPLGIDATTRFATGNYERAAHRSANWRPTRPYNTRTTPACRPARSPTPDWPRSRRPPSRQGGYLFYVVKPGTCGEHSFTESEAEFERTRPYKQAREAEGGESPTAAGDDAGDQAARRARPPSPTPARPRSDRRARGAGPRRRNGPTRRSTSPPDGVRAAGPGAAGPRDSSEPT